jgi:hypothetical protein
MAKNSEEDQGSQRAVVPVMTIITVQVEYCGILCDDAFLKASHHSRQRRGSLVTENEWWPYLFAIESGAAIWSKKTFAGRQF